LIDIFSTYRPAFLFPSQHGFNVHVLTLVQ
jgi:hypothetical protein